MVGRAAAARGRSDGVFHKHPEGALDRLRHHGGLDRSQRQVHVDFGDRVGRSLKSFFGSRNERMVRTFEPHRRAGERARVLGRGARLGEQFKAKTAEWKAAIAGRRHHPRRRAARGLRAGARGLAAGPSGLRPLRRPARGRSSCCTPAQDRRDDDTGEGKTLVATLPLYLNALTGKPVFLVTVNDYLAKRDAEWMGPIYHVSRSRRYGAIQSQMSAQERLPIYHGDIVYGTNSEFGFDYLRDNMKIARRRPGPAARSISRSSTRSTRSWWTRRAPR